MISATTTGRTNYVGAVDWPTVVSATTNTTARKRAAQTDLEQLTAMDGTANTFMYGEFSATMNITVAGMDGRGLDHGSGRVTTRGYSYSFGGKHTAVVLFAAATDH